MLYPARDKWGVVNEVHHGIFPVLIDWNQREGHYFGFADLAGRIHFWGDYPSGVWTDGSPALDWLDSRSERPVEVP